MERAHGDTPVSALTRARKKTARWMLWGYVILSVAGLLLHLAAILLRGIPITWIYFLPTLGIGLGAVSGLLLLRRSLKQGVLLFNYVGAVCVLAILAHELAVGHSHVPQTVMYFIGIFSLSLVLGFRPAVVYATFVALMFFFLALIFTDELDNFVLLGIVAYAAALPGRLVEFYVEESTSELGQVNERLRRENRERREAEARLSQRNRELALLNRATQAFVSTLALDEVLLMILEEIRNLLDVRLCSIWLLDEEDEVLICRQVVGPREEDVSTWQRLVGSRVALQSAPQQILQDVHLAGAGFREIYRDLGVEISSILNLALGVKEEYLGLLQIASARTPPFDTTDLTLLESLAASAAVAIENARLYEDADRLRMFNEGIVQGMGEGILLVDESGEIRFANPKMGVMLSQRPEALVGQHWESFIVPNPQSAMGQSGSDGQYRALLAHYETRLRNKEGRTIPVLVSARPLYEDGRLLGTLAVFTDVSQLKAMEEELRQRNRELVARNTIATVIGRSLDLEQTLDATLARVLELLEACGGWIQLLDPEEEILRVRVQHGLTPRMIEPLDGIAVDEGLTGRLMQSGKSLSAIECAGEEEFSQVNGWGEELRWACVPLKSRERPLGVLGVLREDRDLDDRELQLLKAIGYQLGVAVEKARLTEEAAEVEILREVDRLRSELVSNVSHELRTPLGLIKVFSSTLLREDIDLDPETRVDFLKSIDEETDNLERIVDHLLELGRMESGRLQLDRFPTDLRVPIREVIDSMEVQLTNHEIIIDLPPEPLVAAIDPRRIEQVLRNLLDNAAKYSSMGSSITVGARREGDEILVWVRDEGIGIQPAALDRIFERFYRADNEFTRQTRGVGLGLAVSRGFVEAHGGRIWVQSTPAEGSTFFFTVPAVEERPESARDVESRERAEGEG